MPSSSQERIISTNSENIIHYSVLDDYVERCDNLFTGGSLQLLACSIARELNLQDYAETHTTEVE